MCAYVYMICMCICGCGGVYSVYMQGYIDNVEKREILHEIATGVVCIFVI